MGELDIQHKHILRLIDRDADVDGWAKVSDVLYPQLSQIMPPKLVEFDGVRGNFRAKLTKEGHSVVKAMASL